LVVTCRHASPVFQSSEHNFDPDALTVASLVMWQTCRVTSGQKCKA
jgi:hypothetical protein